MSVLLEYAMFPTDKGESVSEYVSKIIAMIKKSGFEYKLTAMGTIIETASVKQALSIVDKSYTVLEPYTNRVYATFTMDVQKNKNNRLLSKIQSIENLIGEINK